MERLGVDETGLVHGDDLAEVEGVVARLRDPANRCVVSRNRNVTKSGRVISCEWYNSVLHDEAGRMVAVLSLVLDVTGRQEAEERFRALADNIPQLAWMARPDGAIFWFNRRWHEYTGTVPEQVEGWGWESVHDPAEAARVLAKYRSHVASGEPWEDTFPLRRHDGEYRWHLSRAMPVLDDSGRVILWFGTNTDVTEQRRLEEELKRADRLKDVFLATLAHELRNPLAPIRNAVRALAAGGRRDPEPELAWALDVIDRQVGRMSRLLDDLLDVGRITGSKLELRTSRITLGSVVEDAVETSRPLIEAGGHELAVDLPDAPVYLDADPVRLAQVFSNLLNNAARYTDPGGHIRLSAGRVDGEVVVSVADDGIGLAPELIPRLFETFSQAAPGSERSRGGLGIGLSLARGLVERHGGSVVARSDGPGAGSEFTVRLPVADAPPTADRPADGAAVVALAESPVDRKCRIVVADDNRDAAVSLARFLRIIGHEVREAGDGQEAVDLVEEFRPDLALIDLGMPRLDGFEAARLIRQRPEGREMTLVALTGWGREDDKRKSREAGFDAHLTKPVDPDELERFLGSVASKGSRVGQPDSP